MPGIGEIHMCDTTCRLETAVNDHAVIKEKLHSLTAEELLDYALKICLENQELLARCEYQERRLKEMEFDREKAYLNGKVDGLMFSIRCNGVSGAETR